jgi:hypothetical protein
MPRPPETTKIHQYGLADEVKELFICRHTSSWIRKYLQPAHGISDISDVDLLYFKRHHMDNGDQPKPANEVLRKMYADAPLIDVIAERTVLIGLQSERVERMMEYERGPMGLDPKHRIDVGREIERLSELLSAHQADLVRAGILKPGEPIAEEPAADTEQPKVDALLVEKVMIEGGLHPQDAEHVLARALFGAERVADDRGQLRIVGLADYNRLRGNIYWPGGHEGGSGGGADESGADGGNGEPGSK